MTRIELKEVIYQAITVGPLNELDDRLNGVVDLIFEAEHIRLCEEMVKTFLKVHEAIRKDLPIDFSLVRKVSPILDSCYEMVMRYQRRAKQ